MRKFGPSMLLVAAAMRPDAVMAAPAFACAGAAMTGGAELLCSHTDPAAPPQVCSFSWTLMTMASQPAVVTGSFLLQTGVQDSVVYQGSGYNYALSTPVVLCQAQGGNHGTAAPG